MIIKYLLILGIGHLVGDFYLQNEKIAQYKNEEFKGVFLHALEYYIAFLLTVLPVFSVDMILAATCAAIVHFVIDTLKYLFFLKKKVKKGCKVFVIDQCAPIISLFLVAYVMDQRNFFMGHLACIYYWLDVFNYNADNCWN